MTHIAIDASTFADLRPDTPLEPRWSSQRSSSRYQGSHLLNLKRASRDVVNTRNYVHGDPVRMIDWKAYARTDQLMIREVRDEAAVRIGIAISMAESMHWPTPEVCAVARLPRAPTKFECAMRCALNLAYAHLQVGDFVKIFGGVDGINDLSLVWAPRSTGEIQSHFEVIREQQFSREVAVRAFTKERPDVSKFEIAYVATDCLNQDQHSQFLARGRKSALIHVLSALERDTEWMADTWTYYDPNGLGHEYQRDDLVQDRAYVRAIAAWQERMATTQKKAGATYIPVSEQTKLSVYISQLTHLIDLG